MSEVQTEFIVNNGSGFDASGSVASRLLKAGDYTKVAPGEYHKFVCTENAVCFETYWVEFEHDDIVRESVGGAIQPHLR